MLKRNWNWRNNRLFCHIFVIGEISIGRGPCPPCLCLCSKWGKQKRCLQICREISGVFQRNFTCSKNSAVLEPRTGQFSRPRTWGFETKAKDFKMCPRGRGRPRGQGRPRGLHLCWKRVGVNNRILVDFLVRFQDWQCVVVSLGRYDIFPIKVKQFTINGCLDSRKTCKQTPNCF